MKKGIVYSIKNNVYNLQYIGQSVEYEKRKRAHLNMLRSGSHFNHRLQKDWNELGEESFSFHVLEEVCSEDIGEKEMEIINSNWGNLYNIIRDSHIGGDYFTNHPDKEALRKMKSEQMSGTNNHQYGKPKTEKMINSVKRANSKKVSIDGVVYPSATEASRVLGIGATTIHYRIHHSKSDKYRDWFILENTDE